MRLLKIALLSMSLAACGHTMKDSGGAQASLEQGLCTSHTEQADCEAAGCAWDRCPPNADCVYLCNESVSDAGAVVAPTDCALNTTQASCEAATCDWRACPADSEVRYHCVDLHCSVPEVASSQGTCEAAGCNWGECPPDADCVYVGVCSDPAWDACPVSEEASCEQLGALACGAREDCQLSYRGFCDCECTEHQPGGGCEDCGASCFWPACSDAP